MKKLMSLISIVLISFLMTACSSKQAEVPTKASQKVQSMIDKNDLKVVDYTYTKQQVAKGTRNGSKALLIDARPHAKYLKSTIPSSINIPDTKFDEYYSLIKDTNKNKEVIVFCGGWKCTKSPKVAILLKSKGFSNVKLYQGGEPDWIKKSYNEVSVMVTKSAQDKNSALLVDARPHKMFLKETIVGSISIPDTEVEKYLGRFPIDKNQKIITYCGGYKCGKSHKVAKKLNALGYTNVSVFAGGIPAWKKASYSTSLNKSTKQEENKTKKALFSKNGVKLGSDEGTVDGEWFKALIVAKNVPSYIQIVDVTSASEFKEGHLKGAMNIDTEKMNAKDIYAKLPKNKSIIFNCTAGGRSLETWMKLNDAKIDMSEMFYFDANIDCKGNNCKIEVNEPIE